MGFKPIDAFNSASYPFPPRVKGLPVVGALPAFVRDPFGFLLEARQRYGDIYYLDLGVFKGIMLNHPNHAQHMLRDKAENYTKGDAASNIFRTIFGNSILLSEGDFWLRQRRMLQPQFHRQRLMAISDLMVQAAAEGLEVWRAKALSGEALNVSSGFAHITMRLMIRTLFGKALPPDECERTINDTAFVMDYMLMALAFHNLPRWIPHPFQKRYRAALSWLVHEVTRIIDLERQAETPSDSLLGMLVGMVDADTGEQMTNTQLRDEVITFLFAGYETTALALSWTTHFLTRYPEVMAKAQAEVDSVLNGRLPTFADLQSLNYLRMVVHESMRLRPPGWWLPRTASAADEIDGFTIPAGSTVVTLIYGVHHHPEVWEEPEQFWPERFLPEASAQRHKFAWMPFGMGQRQCIGKDFALMEAQIILAMLLQYYKLEALPGRELMPQLATTLRPKGSIFVRLKARS